MAAWRGFTYDPGGLYLLDTRTLTWRARTEGIRRGGFSLAIDPAAPDHVYLGTAGIGVVETIDLGQTWSPAATGLRGMPAWAAASPSDPRVVYSGTASSTAGASVFRSADGGATWSGPGRGFREDDRVAALAVDPIDTKRAFSSLIEYCDGCDEGGLYRTTGGGETWQLVLDELIEAIAVFPADHRRVLALGRFGLASWRSQDGGRTWTRGAGAGSQLWVSPAEAGVAYAIDGLHLLRSADWGLTWISADGDIPSGRWFSALAPDPLKPGVLYAALAHSVYHRFKYDLFRSLDAGVHWKAVGEYFYASPSLVADPVRPGRAYAVFTDGTALVGIYGGLQWEPLPDLPSPAGAAEIAADGSTLFAGTVQGLAALPLDGTEGGDR